MQKRRARSAVWLIPGTAALALGLVAPPLAGAQPPVPAGGEFQVNTYTVFDQDLPSLSADADGDFVVVWRSNGSSGRTSLQSSQGQRSPRRIDAGRGVPDQHLHDGIRATLRVSDATGTSSWSGRAPAVRHGRQTPELHGQRYAPGDRRRVGVQVTLHTTPVGLVVSAIQTGLRRGVGERRLVRTDRAHRSQGQRYASDGQLGAAEFRSTLHTSQGDPSVAGNAGDVVVYGEHRLVRTDTNAQHPGPALRSADRAGRTFRSYLHDDSHSASVHWADGDFVVVCRARDHSDPKPVAPAQGPALCFGWGPHRRRVQATYTMNIQRYSSVITRAGGEFVVVWRAGVVGTDTAGYAFKHCTFPTGRLEGRNSSQHLHDDTPRVPSRGGGRRRGLRRG